MSMPRHRYFRQPMLAPRGGWWVPVPGINPQPTWDSLVQVVRARQGDAFIGEDRVAFMICERDPQYCHKLEDLRTIANKPAGCSSCARRAQQRNGGRIR